MIKNLGEFVHPVKLWKREHQRVECFKKKQKYSPPQSKLNLTIKKQYR